MITITGKSVFGGVSIGKLSFYKRNQKVIKREHVENVESECVRFQEAKAEGIRQLKELYEKSIADVGEANAMIFEIHQMMLEDLDYIESIENIIRSQEVNAEFAVATTADNFAQMFAAMDDAYMRGRAADVKDLSERVLDILCGVSEGIKQTDEPVFMSFSYCHVDKTIHQKQTDDSKYDLSRFHALPPILLFMNETTFLLRDDILLKMHLSAFSSFPESAIPVRLKFPFLSAQKNCLLSHP